MDQLLASLSVGSKRRDVAQLAFNSQGSMLVALSSDMEHSLYLRLAQGHQGVIP